MARKTTTMAHEVWCSNCSFRSDDRKVLTAHMRQTYNHGYTIKGAEKHIDEILRYLTNEARLDSLRAIGWIDCPECREPKDPSTFASPIIGHNREKQVCLDCQPVKVIDTVGAIFKLRYEPGRFGYCLWESDYAQGSENSVEEAERRLRKHVGDAYDRIELILNDADRRDVEQMNRQRARIAEIIALGHDHYEACHIQSGLKTCKEHDACAYRQVA